MLLSEYDFGQVDADDDFTRNHEFFERVFVDVGDVTNRVQSGSCWLVLGRKGTGKSAIAANVVRQAATHNYYAHIRDYKEIWSARARIKQHDNLEASLAEVSTWKLLLLLDVWTAVYSTHSSFQHSSNLASLNQDLVRSGLSFPQNTVWRVVERSLEKGGSLDAKLITGNMTSSEKSEVLGVESLVRVMIEQLYEKNAGLVSRTIVMIDGTDFFLNASDPPWHHVQALLIAARELNMHAQRHKCPITVVILCRTEVFNGIDDTDLNKLRQDRTVELRWFSSSRDPFNTDLHRVWRKRALENNPKLRGFDNPWFELFPDYAVIGKNLSKVSSWEFVKRRTLLRPRDLIAFMKYCTEAGGHLEKLDENALSIAADLYSEKYFVREFDNALTGFVTREDKEAIRKLLKSMGRHAFYFDQWKTEARFHRTIGDERAFELLSLLFDQGYVFMKDRANWIISRFYNDSIDLDTTYDLHVHPGLWRALKIA